MRLGFFIFVWRVFYYWENVQIRLRTESDFSRLDERHNADSLWLDLTDPTRMEKDFSCSFEMTKASQRGNKRSDPMYGFRGLCGTICTTLDYPLVSIGLLRSCNFGITQFLYYESRVIEQ